MTDRATRKDQALAALVRLLAAVAVDDMIREEQAKLHQEEEG